MAEGDSVHRIARRLNVSLRGAVIAHTEARTASLANISLDEFRIVEVVPVGKHLLMRLSNGDSAVTVHSHMRMQGRWTVISAGKRLPRNVDDDMRMRLSLDDGRRLVAVSMPVLEVVDTNDEGDVVGHLGPDILGDDFDVADGAHRMQRDPNVAIVSALLDQRNVCGIGNLWAIEVLFLRGVYPWTRAGEVDAVPLLERARKMMLYSRDVEPGMITTGDRRRGQTHWVYGRYRRPCRRCTTPIAFHQGKGVPYDREVWWCPHCQPQR